MDDYEPSPEQIDAWFLCVDCGQSTDTLDEYYMVDDGLWQTAMPGRRGMLCIGCLEARIGRTLTSADFTGADVNTAAYGPKSVRLLDRLGRAPAPGPAGLLAGGQCALF
jgi:hypothetical protein